VELRAAPPAETRQCDRWRAAPHATTALLEWRNRFERRSWVAIGSAATALGVWFLCGACAGLASRDVLGEDFAWLQTHSLPIAVALGIGFAILTHEQRQRSRAAAGRSWLAALPISHRVARAERVLLDSAPAVSILILMAVCGVTTGAITRARALPYPSTLLPALTVLAGASLGIVLGHVLPLPRPEDLPPGSRYVPRGRRARAAPLRPSLRPLGAWPIRRLFASARPRTVARITVPILLMVPMGTLAYGAMLIVGIAALVIAVATLALATVTVTRDSRRWLAPLPLDRPRLLRHVLPAPLAGMLLAATLLAWLLWVGGVPAARASRLGAGLLAAGAAIAVGGSALILQGRPHPRG
jgi:hypothetical protein